MTVTRLSAADVAVTKSEEGFVDHLYHDAVGVATIGFGTTAGAGVVEPLPETCTEDEATEWLLEYMNRSVVPAILGTGFKPQTGGELGGLADLGYNCGSGVFGLGTTMGLALRSGSLARIADAFMVYVDAGGHVLSDLVHRREEDRALFLETPPHVPTYHYDWFMDGGERTAVERYDFWREQEHTGKIARRGKVCLRMRARQCGWYARRVTRVAVMQGSHERPDWTPFHRGWRRVELDLRLHGKRVLPR